MKLKDILNNNYLIEEKEISDNYSLTTLINKTKEINYERFLSVLDNLNQKALYHSKQNIPIHGPNHIERVLFFANALAIFEDLNDDDYKILMDAASYHDSGRVNDMEDNAHGFYSACKLDTILKNDDFYKQDENMNIIKAIIDYHSQDDDRFDYILDYYEVEDKERCKKLAFLLKDADAIDRVRFIQDEKCYLDTKFLRNSNSILMVEAAKTLVSVYKKPVINEFKKLIEIENDDDEIILDIDLHKNDDIYIKGCFHGIGWDFFKLDSILKNGILSPAKCRKNEILTSRNFDVGCKDYIHVISDDIDSFGTNTAYNNFVKNGISFYALVPELVEGLPYNRKDEAIERGLPFSRGEYTDEMFVKDSIPMDALEYVLFTEEYKDKKLNELDYFDCNFTPKIVCTKAKYYVSQLKNKLGYQVNESLINGWCGIYQDVFASSERNEKSEELYTKAELVKSVINQQIGEYMQDAYSIKLSKKEGKQTIATVENVIKNIVTEKRGNCEVIESDPVLCKLK